MKKLKKRDYDDDIQGSMFDPIERDKYQKIYSDILTEEFYKLYPIEKDKRESD